MRAIAEVQQKLATFKEDDRLEEEMIKKHEREKLEISAKFVLLMESIVTVFLKPDCVR